MNLSNWALQMKYSENNKPLSHHIHSLMYKKKRDIIELQKRNITPFSLVRRKKNELKELENKFVRQIDWERENK